MKISVDTTKFDLKKKILIESIGDMVKSECVLRAPIVTGVLAMSIEKNTGLDFVEVSTSATDSRGRQYASYLEYGTGPIKIANPSFPDDKTAKYIENPLTSWKALKERNEEGTLQTMPFMRVAAFVSHEQINDLFRQAFR